MVRRKKRHSSLIEPGTQIRVALYARVSTADQAKEGYSLDAQLESLRYYCKSRRWIIAQEYVDDGHSGRNTKRPAYQQMLADKDKWDMILVVKMDRIHRNSRNFMDMMETLYRWGKEFTSVQENLDTSTIMGRFCMDIIQRIAQLESEQISERVYTGMRQKASTVGGPLGFAIPYGYDYLNGKLTINEKEAKVVKKIFSLYLKGMSISEIVNFLNERHIPTKHNRHWAKKTVAGILKNALYCGVIEWDDIIRKGTHPPIIDVKEFNRVQRRLTEMIRNTNLRYEPEQIDMKILS